MIKFNADVLITGAGGFIGSHLAEVLVRRGARLRAFVHYNSRNDWGNLEFLPPEILREIEIFPGDVRDPAAVEKAVKGKKTVFHLAALIGIPYSYIAPSEYVSTNVMGTLNVMQACLNQGVEKVVHTSTSETYGTARYTPINEEHPLQGQSPYSASKIGADKIAESYHLSFQLPVATLRPFNTYGPGQSARAVIPSIISQIVSGQTVLKLGSTLPVRDLNYVLDTVEGFIKTAGSERSTGEVINVGSGRGISIGALADKIIHLSGQPVRIVEDKKRIRPEKSEVMKLICDNRKAGRLIGWTPQTTLDEGLKEVFSFVEKNLSLFKPTLYNV